MISAWAKPLSKKKRSSLNNARLPRRFLFFLPLFLLFTPEVCRAASGDFYSFADRWDKQNGKVNGPAKKEAVEQSFAEALTRTGQTGGFSQAPPPRLRLTLSGIRAMGNVVELETGQELRLEHTSEIVKFVPTDEGIVVLARPEPKALYAVGAAPGRTFVHVWDASDRQTFEVRVIPQKIRGLTYADIQRDVIEKSRSFKIKYDVTRSAFHRGEKYHERHRTSLDVNQRIAVEGDTPHGFFETHANIQRSGTISKHILTDIRASLEDGRIGPFDKFNAAAGDSDVKPEMMIFPTGRMRGGYLERWDRPEHRTLQTTHFYGRELSGIVGTLSPFFASQERTKDSFLSGNFIDWQAEDARLRAGYFTGSGPDRADELNKHGFGAKGDIGLGAHVRFKPEIDHDNERLAQKHSLALHVDKWQVRGELRDINQDFQSMIGVPSSQGEKGILLEAAAEPFSKVQLYGKHDVFRDRRIPNPDDPRAENTHTDLRVTFEPADRSTLESFYQNIDDTGRSGPFRLRSLGSQVTHNFDLWERRATLTGRYEHRRNVNLNTPSLTYERDQFTLGFYTRVFWNIYFSVHKEWHWLDEPESDRFSRPEAVTYTLTYSRQVFDTPFYFDANLRIRDEEETESPNSFMTGEDSTALSAGLYYRKHPDWEVYVTGRFENFNQESLLVLNPRVEMEVLVGVRYLHDTGIRWTPVGDFEGSVFKDVNADGIRQPEEPGFEGMKVRTSDGRSAVTDTEGHWKIGRVSGKKTVLTLDSAGLPYGFVPTASLRREMEIEADRTQGVDFGLSPRSEIAGLVFEDTDRNERYDLGEKGLKRVRLLLETGQAVRTNDSGSYSFSGILAGGHEVRLDLSTLPDGYLPTGPIRKSLTVFEGIRYEAHFPLKAQRAVTGKVYRDLNGNSVFDAGDEALAGVTVYLGGLSIATDERGQYLFDELKAGEYELRAGEFRRMVRLTPEPVTLEEQNIPVREAPSV
jgi:hypothetical protein